MHHDEDRGREIAGKSADDRLQHGERAGRAAYNDEIAGEWWVAGHDALPYAHAATASANEWGASHRIRRGTWGMRDSLTTPAATPRRRDTTRVVAWRVPATLTRPASTPRSGSGPNCADGWRRRT